MALQDTLGQSFSSGGFDLSAAVGELTNAFGGIAPAGVDVDPQAIASLATTIAGTDPSGAVGSVTGLASKYGETLSALADPEHLANTFADAVGSISSLGTHLDDLRSTVVGGLTSNPPGERPVDRFVAGADPFHGLHLGPIGDVLRLLGPGTVPVLPPALTSVLPALLGQAAAVRTLADQLAQLAAGATVTSRLGTLADSLTAISDPARVGPATTAVLALDGAALAARVGSADADDPVVADVSAGLAALTDYADAVNQLILGGLAVLDVLDPAPLTDLMRGAATSAGTAVTGPVHDLAQTLATQLAPILSKRPTAANAPSVTAFADTFASGLSQAVTAVQTVDVSVVTAPIQHAIDAVLAPVRAVSKALHDALELVRSAIAAARSAVEAIGLQTVVDAVHTVIDPVVHVVDQLRALLEPVATTLGTIAATTSAAIATLRQNLEQIIGRISAAFTSMQQAVDGLHLTDQLGTVKSTMDGVADSIEGVHIGEAVDAAVGFVHDATDVISKIPFDLLPKGAQDDVHNAVAPLKSIDFGTEVREPLTGAVQEILSGIEGPFLDEVSQAFAELENFLKTLDPTPLAQQLEQDGFQPFLDRVQALDPDVLLAPIRDALSSLGSLKTLLDPADEAFDKVLHAIEQLDPAPLLDPIANQVDSVRTEIRSTLALDHWAEQVTTAADGLLEVTDLFQLSDVVDAVVVLMDRLWPAPESEQHGVVGAQALGRLLGPAAEILDLTAFGSVLDWMAGRRTPVDDLTGRIGALRGALTAAHDRAAAVDPGAVVAAVTPAFTQVAGAIEALPAGDRKDRLAPLVASVPASLLAPAVNARGDLLTRIGTAGSQLDALAAVSATPLTTLSTALRSAFEPLHTVQDFVAAWVARCGGSVGTDLRAALHEVLTTVADRVRPQAAAFDAAVHDKLQTVIEQAVRAPLQAATTELNGLIDALDVHPVVTEIEQLFTALHDPLAALRPSTALADLVTAIDGLVGDTAAWDPFRDVRGPLNQMKADVAAAADELRPTVLLAPVISTYNTVLSAVQLLNVRELFDRTLAALHKLEGDIETGLADAEAAITELQDALP